MCRDFPQSDDRRGVLPVLIYFEVFSRRATRPEMDLYIRYRGVAFFRTYLATAALGCCMRPDCNEFKTRRAPLRSRYRERAHFRNLKRDTGIPKKWTGVTHPAVVVVGGIMPLKERGICWQ